MTSAFQFWQAQRDNPQLQRLAEEDPREGSSSRDIQYEERGGLLYWVRRECGAGKELLQLIVPSIFHRVVWQLAHGTLVAGHLGWNKTKATIIQSFF